MYGILLAAALTGSAAAPDQNGGWVGPPPSAVFGAPGFAGGCAYGAGPGGHNYGGFGYVSCGPYGAISGWDAMNCGKFGGHSTYACIGFIGCSAGPGGPRIPPETLPNPRLDRSPAQGNAAAARVTLTVPAQARVTVDGKPVQVSSPTKTFTVPGLDRDHTYYYEFRAEVVRDGVPYSEKKKVLVRAGEEVKVSFATLPPDELPAPAPAVAAAEVKPRH